MTIRNSSGFAFTTIQLSGPAEVIAVPAVEPRVAILRVALAFAGWLEARRLQELAGPEALPPHAFNFAIASAIRFFCASGAMLSAFV